jgi:hypothetical protein
MNELKQVRTGVWQAGNCAWVFGLCDRTLASLSDNLISAGDIIQLSTASLLFVAWLLLRPNNLPIKYE